MSTDLNGATEKLAAGITDAMQGNGFDVLAGGLADVIEYAASKSTSGFSRLDSRLDGMENRMEGMENRLDGRLDGMEKEISLIKDYILNGGKK